MVTLPSFKNYIEAAADLINIASGQHSAAAFRHNTKQQVQMLSEFAAARKRIIGPSLPKGHSTKSWHAKGYQTFFDKRFWEKYRNRFKKPREWPHGNPWLEDENLYFRPRPWKKQYQIEVDERMRGPVDYHKLKFVKKPAFRGGAIRATRSKKPRRMLKKTVTRRFIRAPVGGAPIVGYPLGAYYGSRSRSRYGSRRKKTTRKYKKRKYKRKYKKRWHQ